MDKPSTQVKWITIPVLAAIILHTVTITRYITKLETTIDSEKVVNTLIHNQLAQDVLDHRDRLRALEKRNRERD